MPFTCLDVAKAALGQPKKQSGHEHHFRCPNHDDHTPSLMVNEKKDVWLCGPCNRGGTPWELAAFLAGFDPSDKSSIVPWLQEHHLLDGSSNNDQPTIVSEYIYLDGDGNPALKVLRYEPKSFRQQVWDGTSWNWKGQKPKLLYHLPELLAKPERWVILVEGERDADKLISLRFLATCNPGGALKWDSSYTETLKGRFVAILPDNDPTGHAHAVKVAQELFKAGCQIRVVELPKLAPKGDVSDWLTQGHTYDELKAVILKTLVLDAAALNELEAKWLNEARQDATERSGEVRPEGDSKTRSDTPKLLRQGFHDAGNAERLKAVHGRDLRYCYEFRKWLIFDGRRWVPDTHGTAERWSKETIVSFLRQAVATENEAAEKHARRSLNVGRINGMLALAQCELPIASGDLDAHPYLLNCLNGTLDLKTGKLRKHARKDYLTKLVHFKYKTEAECPRFKEFLYEIMGSTSDSSEAELERVDQLVEYLQKAFGYACTGDTSEKKVFCFFGGGDNGKTTLLEAVRHVLAEYAHQVLISSLMARTIQETNASLADLADLRGARFVTTSEGERGQRFAEAKLKYLTAGMGDIKTCRKYENPITFPATHKLFIDSNYKPRVRGTDAAIWSRLRPIPFTIAIPPERIDKGLLAKLELEGEGLLAWLIEGCQKWQRDGLLDPQEVFESAKGWQAENNPLRDFIGDICFLDLDRKNGEEPLFCGSAALSQAYRQWALDNGEKYSLSPQEFGNRLEHMGCERGKKRINGKEQRVWFGIGLKEEVA